ncbi:MAG TPA: response regulator [Candidatus Paceibacterota bacterium]|jgi:DNA-binding response OmpR family regulator|nr:response regulator [Candidatus Paceibacterota bacterium]
MKKVLIIEDDNFLQGLEAGKLKKENYDIITASSGEEGLKMINEPNVDLILLDLVLPKFDGFEILQKIREGDKTKKIPVIVFSNLSEDKDIKKAEKLGANDFMIKSNFTLDELIEHINKILK